jgi:Spy/CpxP family protein refolding chaperone
LTIAAALVAGLVLGALGATVGYVSGYLHLPGERPLYRMARVLDLTPAQREQIGEVMEQTREQIHAAHRDFLAQRSKLLYAAYLKIHVLLTPEQQRKFDRDFVPPRFRQQAAANSSPTSSPPASPASPTP